MANDSSDVLRLNCTQVNKIHDIITKDIQKYEAILRENLHDPENGISQCKHREQFCTGVSKLVRVLEQVNFHVFNHVPDVQMRDRSGRQANPDSGIASDGITHNLTLPIEETGFRD